jgi:uncharacterized caspase-like protein
VLYPSRRVLLAGLALSLFKGSSLRAQDTAAAHALVIGISYQGARPGLQLGNTLNDAALIESQFQRLRFQSVQRIDDPSAGGFQQSLDQFVARLNPHDVALIYVASHGVQIAGQNYLLLNDGMTFVSLLTIVRVVRSATDVVVFLLDACRNNPFEELPSASRGLRATRVVSTQTGLSRAPQTSVSFVSEHLVTAAAKLQRLGAFELQGTGIRIVFATDPNNVAADYVASGDRNSPFANAIARRIMERRSLDDVISLTTGDVVRATGGTQSPWSQGSIGRPIYLAGPPENKNPTALPRGIPG